MASILAVVGAGAVVDPLEQQDGLTVHRLREKIHSHRSHRTERSSTNTVRWCSAQAERKEGKKHDMSKDKSIKTVQMTITTEYKGVQHNRLL